MIKKSLIVACLLFYSFWSFDYFSFSKKEYDRLTLPTINWDILKFWEIKEANAYTRTPSGNVADNSFLIKIEMGDVMDKIDPVCGSMMDAYIYINNVPLKDDNHTFFVDPSVEEYITIDRNDTLLNGLLPIDVNTVKVYRYSDDLECATLEGNGIDTIFTINSPPETGMTTENRNNFIASLFSIFLNLLPIIFTGMISIIFALWSFKKIKEILSDVKTSYKNYKDYKLLVETPEKIKKSDAKLERIKNPNKKTIYD